MGTVFLHGRRGGGNPLNFRVLGGTTAPSSPQENDIWVNTDTEITQWVFSAEEPASPLEGMVWIKTALAGSAGFNALRKNEIQVCPSSAQQYMGGAWVGKAGKSYRGGVWVDWRIYLYNSGDECVNASGGWSLVKNGNENSSLSNWEIKKQSDHINLYSSATGWNNINLVTANLVNMDNLHTLVCSTEQTNNGQCWLCVSSTKNATNSGAAAKVQITGSGVREASLDVSGLTGSYYFFIFVGCNGATTNFKLYSLYGE